jgi:hypothetical protein
MKDTPSHHLKKHQLGGLPQLLKSESDREKGEQGSFSMACAMFPPIMKAVLTVAAISALFSAKDRAFHSRSFSIQCCAALQHGELKLPGVVQKSLHLGIFILALVLILIKDINQSMPP